MWDSDSYTKAVTLTVSHNIIFLQKKIISKYEKGNIKGSVYMNKKLTERIGEQNKNYQNLNMVISKYEIYCLKYISYLDIKQLAYYTKNILSFVQNFLKKVLTCFLVYGIL